MRKNSIHFLVFLSFLVVTAIFTFPLFFNLKTSIPGYVFSNEVYSQLWEGWRTKYSIEHNITLRFTNLIAYPFGVDIFSDRFISHLYIAECYLLNAFATPILAHNLEIILNHVLSFAFVYILVFYLLKDALSAALSAIIFSFCPFRTVRNLEHINMTFTQWFPMVLFALALLKNKPGLKNSLFLLLSFLLLFFFDFSIMYIGLIMSGLFLIYCLILFLVLNIENKKITGFYGEEVKTMRRYIISIILVLLAAFLIYYPLLSPIFDNVIKFSSTTVPSAHNPYRRPFEDLFRQSARPLSYFLPAFTQPVFGRFTEQLIGSSLYGLSFIEHTLFLGWITLILAYLAVNNFLKHSNKLAKNERPYVAGFLNGENRFWVGFFMFLGLGAWFFSQPPWWQLGFIKIPMPSFFLYKILPMFRAYCRFGIIVMLAVAVLAGFGLKYILERIKKTKTKVFLSGLVFFLVLFEFWSYPPYKVIDVSKMPAAYNWLKEQPKGLVLAEYPLDWDSPSVWYKLYQTKHGKKMINGTIPGTYANKVSKSIAKLSHLSTARVLKWLGVKYVFVHEKSYLDSELIEMINELKNIPNNPGLKFVRSFPEEACPRQKILCVRKTGQILVYEVIAKPESPSVSP